MKVPAPQRRRIPYRALHRQWRRAIADVDRYFSRIEQSVRHAVLQQLAAKEEQRHADARDT